MGTQWALNNISIDDDGNVTTSGNVAATGNVTAAGQTVSSITGTTGGDLEITAADGKDLLATLGDDAGANKLSIRNKSDAEVASIDSEGGLTLAGLASTLLTLERTSLDTAGAIPATASFVSLNEDLMDPGTEFTLDETPQLGKLLIITCNDISSSVVVKTPLTTIDGTNDVATFDAVGETLVLFGAASDHWSVVANIGSVALSTSGT